ncbi:hypothetical protein [Paracoccus sp. J39]|uniref:hypothetical protein n=1 Tax=Paracoccus sp. J39 TaxID=935848 RepID=UPI0012EBB900|nr:hypothetical protein [Paracoccus sp. J39]
MSFAELKAKKQRDLDRLQAEMERMEKIRPTVEKVMTLLKEKNLDVFDVWPERRPKPSGEVQSVREEIENELKDAEVDIAEVFPEFSDERDVSFPAKGSAKKTRSKQASTTTITTAEFEAAGLKLVKGGVYKNPETEEEYKYGTGRAAPWLSDLRKEMFGKFTMTGEKSSLPLVRIEADKSAE